MKTCAFQKNTVPVGNTWNSVGESTVSDFAVSSRISYARSSAKRGAAALQETSGDLRRIGFTLCLVSSMMTLASAVTLAVYLL